MNHCEEYQELLSLQADGQLPDDQSEGLSAHLAGCPACASFRRDLAVLLAELPSLTAEPPDTLAPGVLYKIGLNENPARRRPFVSRRALAALGTVAAALVLVTLLQGRLPMFGGSNMTSDLDDAPRNSAPSAQDALTTFNYTVKTSESNDNAQGAVGDPRAFDAPTDQPYAVRVAREYLPEAFEACQQREMDGYTEYLVPWDIFEQYWPEVPPDAGAIEMRLTGAEEEHPEGVVVVRVEQR